MRATRLIGKAVIVAVVAATAQLGANATAGAATMVETAPASAVATPQPLRTTADVMTAPASAVATPQPLRATEFIWSADGSLTVVAAVPASAVPSDVQPNISFSYTFSRTTTQRIYTYALLGVAAVERYCSTLPWPSWILAACSYIAGLVVGYMVGNPPNGRCLRVTASLSWPPRVRASLRYVTCPPSAAIV